MATTVEFKFDIGEKVWVLDTNELIIKQATIKYARCQLEKDLSLTKYGIEDDYEEKDESVIFKTLEELTEALRPKDV